MDQNIKENVQKYLQESRKEIKKSTEVILVEHNGKQIVVIGQEGVMSEKKKETNTRKDATAFLKYLKNTGKVVTKEELRVLVEQLPEGVILEVDIENAEK